jgi:signal transduction histidine kinase
MKINAKDVTSGLMLVGVALAGLLINGGFFGLGWEQHSLGTARRMGPGYMPMLTFWLLLGLGALVLVTGLFNGPDRLERWAWRELVLVLAAMCVFGILLEPGGLFVTIAATVAVASLAERTHTIRGVIGLIIFLLALCWYVFIRELDIRIEIWPAFWR